MKVIHQTSAGGIVCKKSQTSHAKSQIEWLVCQHSQHKGWVFPKGLVGDVNAMESMEDAALREVAEEGGVQARIVNPLPVKVFYSYVWEGERVDKTVYYYLMEYVSGDPKNHDWEMMDAKFIDKAAVMKILTYPSDQEAFEKLLGTFHD